MTFRDTAELDLDEVFFDLDEFAEEHCVDGEYIPVVPDMEAVEKFQMKDARGLFQAKKAFYAQCRYLKYEPVFGQFMDFDGQQYQIVDVAEEQGIYKIILGVVDGA